MNKTLYAFSKAGTQLSLSGLLISSCTSSSVEKQQAQNKPNIIYILADDMGYGDIRGLNPESKIPTPHLDGMIKRGMHFTDAHTPSAVCTPTRYGVLTGRYCFRTRLEKGVLVGHSPSLIEPGRTTVATVLKSEGYVTACIGKWHLGLDWPKKDTKKPLFEGNPWDIGNTSNIDYSGTIHGGPCEHGFDYSYILPASLDIQPYVFVSNRKVVNTKIHSVEGIREEEGMFWRHGDASDDFRHEESLDIIASKSLNFIRNQAKNRSTPFFLYFPLTAPHTPWLPDSVFQGTSEAGKYGDFVVQVDHVAGQILDLIDSLDISRETIIFFTSDNGAFWKKEKITQYNHKANYIFSGMKSDVWEGGHRVPYIVQWDGKIKAGIKSDRLVCLTDLLATIAELTNRELALNEGEDSFSHLSELIPGPYTKQKRETMIMQSINGTYAVRSGPWKLIMGKGSGGWTYAGNTEDPEIQLYNIVNDPEEKSNLYLTHDKLVDSLTSIFNMYVTEQRSRW